MTNLQNMSTATITYHDLNTWDKSTGSGVRTPVSALQAVFQDVDDQNLRWNMDTYDRPYPFFNASMAYLRRSNKPPKSRLAMTLHSEELCLVCGDKASGYHYNALTCEGCKGFFRRSITRKATYYCKYGRNCEIDMYMRRKCQHCRLEKCSRIGMRAELVIPEEQCRIKREAKLRQRTGTVMMSPRDSDDSEIIPPSLHELSTETLELVARTTAINRQFLQPTDEAMTSLSMHCSASHVSHFQHLAELTILEAQLIHEFVRALPGFAHLCDEDKKVIQKKCKSEVLLLRAAQRYDVVADMVVFGNENYQYRLSEQDYVKGGMHAMAKPYFEFIQSVVRLAPDNKEMSLLQAIVVFSERDEVQNRTQLEEIQEVYLATLQQYIETQRPFHKALFAKLIVKLADLKKINGTLSVFHGI